jgi:exodeoxyribonuclease VII large subunit
MSSRILNVSVVNAYLKQLLESDDVLNDCWIEGEVTERFEARSGHIYFTIVDGQSMLKCVIFRGNALRQRSRFRDGDRVVAHGNLTIYEQRSQYQLIADSVQPAGQGLQALKLELLRQKLEAEGLFEESRKRPLPSMPGTIGVVTSGDGAVWHDIQHVLSRRYPLATLVLSPAQVQGDGAAKSLIQALNRLIETVAPDVIIIGRGGGSAEDLAAFNDEGLVRAIFASPIPVVCAVGHETDWSLADLVADVRAPTPSAAAEMIAPSIEELDERSKALGRAIQKAGHGTLDADIAALKHLQRMLGRHSLGSLFERYRSRSQQAAIRISTAGHTRLERSSGRVELLSANGRHHWQLVSTGHRARVEQRRESLRTLDPHSVLQRGFALLTHTETGSVIRSVSQLRNGDGATATISDGRIDTMVVNIAPREDVDA